MNAERFSNAIDERVRKFREELQAAVERWVQRPTDETDDMRETQIRTLIEMYGEE